MNDHENAVSGIDTITLATSDIAMVERIMSAVLGAEGESVRDDALNASGIVYQVGPHRLEYLTPDDERSPLHEHITLKKPVPYRIRLKMDGRGQRVAPAEAANARIEFA